MPKRYPAHLRNSAFVKRTSTIVGKNYARLLGELKLRIRRAHVNAAINVNGEMLGLYWDLGREICRFGNSQRWERSFQDCLSLDLRAAFEGVAGLSDNDIRHIAGWFAFYSRGFSADSHLSYEEIPMPDEFRNVPWGHHITIFTRSSTHDEALYYISKTIEHNWSRSQLEIEISARRYYKECEDSEPTPPGDPDRHATLYGGLISAMLKVPYDFGLIDEKVAAENDYKDSLADSITRYLLELREGFALVGRRMELHMATGQTYFPDIIYYHARLHCYVVCQIKVKPFVPDYVAKINMYMSAVDDLLRGPDDYPTIGLLICKADYRTDVDWILDDATRLQGETEYAERAKFHIRARRQLPTSGTIRRLINTYH